MKMLKEKWKYIFEKSRALDRLAKHHKIEMNTPKLLDMQYDMDATEVIMREAEVIIIPSETIIELVHTLNRIDCRGQLHLPFPYVMIQFTRPIAEKEVMAHEDIDHVLVDMGYTSDDVEGMLIANSYQDADRRVLHQSPMINAIMLFTSTAANRVAWIPGSGKSIPHWDRPIEISSNALANKYRMMELSYAIDLFLNAPNVTIHRTVQIGKVQKKREKKGKALLPEYHTVVIDKTQYETSGPKGTGSAHSRMYPVRGHFRKYKHLEKPVWIPNHYRGLAHAPASMVKEVYKVPPKKP